MNRKHQKSWGMAYCGIVTALCVALMLLGAVIPIAMFIAPAVAGFLVATVCVECGMQLALTAYAAVSLLALLFVPDKEVALIFVFLLGYYPLAKPRFDRIRPAVLRCVCKLLLCNAAVLAMYGLLLVLIPAGSISQELRTTAWMVTLSTLAMGNVAFCCTTGPCTTCSCCTGWCGSPSCTGCWACTENDCCTAVAQNGKVWYTEPPAAHRGRRKRECKTTS